jgi:VWFA-related protein
VRITTNLVQVDAIVTDKSGKAVTDLKQDEIQILEDGRQQRISHFSYIMMGKPVTTSPAKPAPKAPNPALAPPAALKAEQVQRTIAIVVDDLGLSFESIIFVRRALKKFVEEQMQPGDLVAIVRTAAGIGVLQQFTGDRRQLLAAIEHLRWYPNGREGIHAVTPVEPDQMAEAAADAQGTQVPTDVSADELTQHRAMAFSVGTLGSLRYVVKGLRELPGRKSILLISDGFAIDRNYDESLHQLVDQAGRASVAIYTMNATGLQTLGFSAADSISGRGEIAFSQIDRPLNDRRSTYLAKQEGLNYLAAETGGIAIHDNNDLNGGIRRVLEDQRGYYLIGYRPDETTFDPKTGRRTYHKLSLRVMRPGGFIVRMHNGFFGVTDQEVNSRPSTPEQQMFAALASPFGSESVHVRLTSFFANDAKLGSYMRSMLHVDAADLTFAEETDGSRRTRIDLLAITFGADGSPVEQISGPATLHVPAASYQRVLRDGLLYFVTVPIKKPGAYQLRMALRDEASQRVGSASQFVEVPDIKSNRLMLSGIILRGGDQTAGKTPTSEQSASTGDQNLKGPDGESDVVNLGGSAAVRRFQHGQVVHYAFAIYNARLDKSTGRPQTQIHLRLFSNGQPLSAATAQPIDLDRQTDLKRLTVSGAMRLSSELPPGEYVLQVIATDPLADQKHRIATQWIDFEIVK